jgi:hypothetical protein
MSLFNQTLGLLTMKPKVWTEGEKLIGRCPLSLRLLTLFFYDKTVTVDRRIKLFKIESKILWIFKSHTIIPFKRIKSISYAYDSMSTSYSLLRGSMDEVENYSIYLELTNPEERLKVFNFFGEGAVNTGLTGVLCGDDIVDFKGDQEDTSRSYIDLLLQYTGKNLT